MALRRLVNGERRSIGVQEGINMQVIFGLLGVGLLLAAILSNGQLGYFLNAESAFLVCGGTLCLSLATFPVAQLDAAFRAAIKGGGTHRDVVVLGAVRRLALNTGVLGLIVGLVTMMSALDDPKRIGPAMAVALLSSLYAVLLAEGVLGPLTSRAMGSLDVSLAGAESEDDTPSRGGAGLVFGVLGLGAIAFGMVSLAHPSVFFNAPSALLVLGGTVLFTLSFHSVGAVWGAIVAAGGRGRIDADTGRNALAVFGSARIIAIAMGLIGSVIGMVSMLAKLDDPTTIGPALSVALLAALYGLGLGELLITPQISRMRRRTSSETSAPPAAGSNTSVVFALMLGLLLVFFVMMFSLK